MSNLKQVQQDPRSFHGTQSIIRTSLGMSPETGRTSSTSRLMAGAIYAAPITVNLDTKEFQTFDLPPGTYIGTWLCAEGGSGTGGLVKIMELDEKGDPIQVALAAGVVDEPTIWAALDVPMEAQDLEKTGSIRVEPEGTGTGTATIILQVVPIISAWK